MSAERADGRQAATAGSAARSEHDARFAEQRVASAEHWEAAAGGWVLTCEHASVSPYVRLTGTPAAHARPSSAPGTGPPPVNAQRSAGG